MDATKNLFSTYNMDMMASGAKALGQVTSGIAENKQNEFQAKQMEANAKASRANASRNAEQERRRGDILLSNARAAMASNGGVTTDAGAESTLAGIEEAVDYNSLATLYEGENQAIAQETAAQGKRYAGRMARKRGYTGGLSTIMNKYNKSRKR